MNEAQYHAQLDNLMMHLEEILDAAESDLDYVTSGGLMTITCESGVQLVVSRQAPLLQLWLASPAGGMRFVFDEAVSTWFQDDETAASFAHVMGHILARFADEELDCSSLDG
ncbi:MAG: iron donor protein CyaY [Gammaproteobacteria bacterium]|jgi:CyaY protein|nr:iron donor protein CyaY [Gammaproteobacteria bacterium]MCP4879409.1 iron donor protein CyaY [Gammaproteobacteria bacterium]MDP6164787.1 iron donor protein CyaY [Gammaproteobacteria bacterium]